MGEPGQPERRRRRGEGAAAAAEDRAGERLEADVGLRRHQQTPGMCSSVRFHSPPFEAWSVNLLVPLSVRICFGTYINSQRLKAEAAQESDHPETLFMSYVWLFNNIHSQVATSTHCTVSRYKSGHVILMNFICFNSVGH